MAEQSDPAVSLLHSDTNLFLDGAEVTVTSVRTGMWNYKGQRAAVPALLVQYTIAGTDRQPEVQAYTVGSANDRYPSDDGHRFHSATKQGLPNGCNGLRLLESFVAEGFPRDRVEQDVTVFDGCRVVLGAVARPKTQDDKSEGERTVLLVRRLLALPEAAGATTAAPKGKAAPAAAKPATAAPAARKGGNGDASTMPADLAGNEDAKTAAVGALLELLGDERIPKPIKRSQLGALCFKLLAQSPQRNAATKLLSQYGAEFLTLLAAESLLSYDAQAQTISGAA